MDRLQNRYQQANKEAKWAIFLTLGYFAWWYVSAYVFSSPAVENQPIPELYFGLPLWFLLSCVVGPVVFIVLCMLMVKFIYRDISLDGDEEK